MSKHKIGLFSERYRSESPVNKIRSKQKGIQKINIHEACCEGRIDDIKLYLEKSTKIQKAIEKKDVDNFCPLHYAVRYNHLILVKYLLNLGANPNVRGGDDLFTPLHLAAQYKSYNSPSLRKSTTTPACTSKECLANSENEPISLANLNRKIRRGSHEKIPETHDSSAFVPLFKKTKMSVISPICFSEMHGDSIIKILIAAGADINARDRKDATPLHFAAMRKNVSAVEELLNYSILNIECKDSSWMTPLHYAAEQGCTKISNLLISNGADIAALNHFDMTPLHLASDEGHPDVVELLINRMNAINPNRVYKYVNCIDNQSQTAIHYSALAGNAEVTSILLKYGADPFITTFEKSSTPLHLACTSGSYEVVFLLAEKHPSLIDKRNSENKTSLHIASRLNRQNIVEYLLSRTNEIDCFDKDLETPLIMATKKDNINIVKLLLERGADMMNRDANDFSVLHVAASNNSSKCAEFFLQSSCAGLLQNSWDYHENRPIHLAVQSNNLEMVSLLLENNAPIDSKNDSGLTPLLIASVKGYAAIVKLILEFSPALALDEDDKNNTALHHVSMNGHYRLIKILANAGINIDSRNAEQLTPLDLAARNGHVKVANLLIEFDASIEPSGTGKSISPLMVACQNGNSDMVTLLLNKGADVTREDSRGRNCLEVAIDENRSNVALSIINSNNWESALRHVSRFKNVFCSPLRRLIYIMPDVAEIVLDKCLTNNGLPLSHPVYELNCNYEYLEDQHFEWGKKLQQAYSGDRDYNKNENKLQSPSHFKLFCSFFKNLRHHSNNKDHPLSLIVEKRRVNLIRHPLTRYLIRYKWKCYASYAYYLRLFFSVFFVILLTSFCILTASPPYKCIKDISDHSVPELLNHSYIDELEGCLSCPLIPDKPDILYGFFVIFGKYLIVVIGMVNIITRSIIIVMNPTYIASAQNIFEISGSFCAILFVSGVFTLAGRPLELIPFYRCTNYFRSVGALSVCFTWLSLVLLLSKVPKIGIYVVMYSDIFRTFVQFMPIYFMLLLSFAFPFYLVFLDRYETNSYINPGKAIMKTFLGMVGEVEYDTFYNTSEEPPLTVAYIILFIFLLSNSIILMNLLVGLAVDDIQGVQSNAFLTRLGLQVNMAMEIESMVPRFLQNRLLIFEQSIFPNKAKTLGFWSLWEFKSNPFTDKKDSSLSYDKSQEVNYKEFKEELRGLKHQLKTINEKNQKIEIMLEDILKRTPIRPTDLDI